MDPVSPLPENVYPLQESLSQQQIQRGQEQAEVTFDTPRDHLEISGKAKQQIVLQVVGERVVQYNGFEEISDLLERRVEEEGVTIESTLELLKTHIEKDPESENLHLLDPQRVGALLHD